MAPAINPDKSIKAASPLVGGTVTAPGGRRVRWSPEAAAVGRRDWRIGGVLLAAWAVTGVVAPLSSAVGQPPAPVRSKTPPALTGPAPTATAADDADADEQDFQRKAALLQSSRWRRAVFELGEWLSGQEIYTPEQVIRMKADFNRRVAAMSSAELDDLLDDLEMKFKVMDTPEARDARSWVGQYLSAMTDRRRQEALRDVPDVVAMSAGQLAAEIQKIEQRRDAIRQRQQDFDQSRQALVTEAQANRQATSQAIAAGQARAAASASYSPYSRPNNDGKLPFSNVNPYQSGFGFGFGFGGGGFLFGSF